ncbi:uncharacterized protein LOC107367069 [Tetranychus urticae]|uniref:Uncharacterized protein n=1 Tax=Tetranychus urticae TaxID=32264 RepID=T1JSA1_TETUR|nr:uncharacterized protein LOC107367069 [Tetranychus urticae]
MRKLTKNGLILLFLSIAFISGQSSDPNKDKAKLPPNKYQMTVLFHWEPKLPADSYGQPNWPKLIRLLLSQIFYDVALETFNHINNELPIRLTLPLAIGFGGLITAIIALIVACQANWKITKYEFKSAERRRREREIEEVHLKIYEQVMHGDRHDPYISSDSYGHSLERLIRK